MKVISKARQFDAIQWDGKPETLRAIQNLIWPASPLLAPADHNVTALGVMVRLDGTDRYVKYELRHVDLGGWLTVERGAGDGARDGAAVTIWSDAQFKLAFTAPELIALEPLDLDRLGAYAAEMQAATLHASAEAGAVDVAYGGVATLRAAADGAAPVTGNGSLVSTSDPLLDPRD